MRPRCRSRCGLSGGEVLRVAGNPGGELRAGEPAAELRVAVAELAGDPAPLVVEHPGHAVVVDGEHGTVLGVGKSTYTPGYVASERLKLLVEHAYPTCTGPNCGKAAWRCDLDHQTPHGHGGATCECNVRPLCRTCHRLKTAGLLAPEQRNHPDDPPGTTTWTTRTGRAYTALPHVPLPPYQPRWARR